MRRRADAPVQRMYRFRMSGLVYLAVTGFLAVAAISSQNNLLFWALGLAVAGIGVSGVISGLGLLGIRVEREPIPDGSAGDRMVVRYRVRNTNWLAPAFGLTISEREPTRRRRVRTPWSRCVTRPVAFVTCVRPGQSVVAEARPLATRRGQPEFTDLIVASGFPFGLATKSLRFAQHRTALVYPAPATLDPRVLEHVAAGAGREGATGRIGDNTGDFYGVREYVPGDAMRSISWRASARVGDLVVLQNALPAPTRLWVRLHLSGAADAEETEATIGLAAGVLKLAIESGFIVGLVCPEYGLHTLPASGRAGLRNALSRLASLETDATAEEPQDRAALPHPGPRELVVTVRPHGGGASDGGPGFGNRLPGRILTLDSGVVRADAAGTSAAPERVA
ncbi:MAG: DUF58 domain-containing protein [Phycisphaerales bacterium JB041]